ncbi:DciA family protein [Corynebacterium aquilae]|nr:DciA family protein [Corynebacterium aquilae]
MRQQAQRANGSLPNMARPVTRTPQKKSTSPVRRLGRPTGPDGRALKNPRNPVGIGGLIDREISARGWRAPIAGGWVHGHWDDVVGEKIAQHTRVEMFKDGTLFITCDSTAWATNLRVMQRQILQTIAEKVGPGVVTKLNIFGPKAPSWRKGPLHVKGRGPRDTYG